MSQNRMVIDALAAALLASGREQGRSFTEVAGRWSAGDRAAMFTFRFPPGWVLPRDVEAFARELYEQLNNEAAASWGQPDPRTLKLLDLARRMHAALRQDESGVSLLLSDNVLRDRWPAAVAAEAVRRIEAAEHGREQARRSAFNLKAAYSARIASLKRTRAMRVNPADPRVPA